ncbi:hypothetical protein GCM10020331_087400 [Ectobacillus funiculus]
MVWQAGNGDRYDSIYTLNINNDPGATIFIQCNRVLTWEAALWNGKQIGFGIIAGNSQEINGLVFRRTFTAPADYESATLSISADTKYAVYINGELIGSGPVRGWTSEWYYDQYDVSGLNKGEKRHCGISKSLWNRNDALYRRTRRINRTN